MSNSGNNAIKKNEIPKRIGCNVDIDSVTEEKGAYYINWIKITKQKLKERECNLMSVREAKIKQIVNRQCEIFVRSNNTLNKHKINCDAFVIQNIMNECMDQIHVTLNRWNGINLTKTKKSFTVFRQYFMLSKSWFDQTKKFILAPEFWIKVFIHLQQFTADAAKKYFKNNHPHLQKLYSENLVLTLFSSLFSAKLRFAGTKSRPLIAGGMIKSCNPMKQYLLTLDQSLNIKNCRKTNAMQILDLINKQLLHLSNESQKKFKNAMLNCMHTSETKSEFEHNTESSNHGNTNTNRTTINVVNTNNTNNTNMNNMNSNNMNSNNMNIMNNSSEITNNEFTNMQIQPMQPPIDASQSYHAYHQQNTQNTANQTPVNVYSNIHSSSYQYNEIQRFSPFNNNTNYNDHNNYNNYDNYNNYNNYSNCNDHMNTSNHCCICCPHCHCNQCFAAYGNQ